MEQANWLDSLQQYKYEKPINQCNNHLYSCLQIISTTTYADKITLFYGIHQTFIDNMFYTGECYVEHLKLRESGCQVCKH